MTDAVMPNRIVDVMINVEVVYALPSEQKVVQLSLAEKSTVSDAITASGLYARYAEIEPGKTPVGIYAERVTYDTLLRDGDRVEIYRPLEVDPMQARRLRAQSQAQKSKH